MLSARFHINIGIYYEDSGDYIRAYEYFKDWAEICVEVRERVIEQLLAVRYWESDKVI